MSLVIAIHVVFDEFVFLDVRISTSEIESCAFIFGSHKGLEFAAGSNVIFSTWGFPVIGGKCPFCNMLRSIPKFPNFLNRSFHNSLYGYLFHFLLMIKYK